MYEVGGNDPLMNRYLLKSQLIRGPFMPTYDVIILLVPTIRLLELIDLFQDLGPDLSGVVKIRRYTYKQYCENYYIFKAMTSDF